MEKLDLNWIDSADSYEKIRKAGLICQAGELRDFINNINKKDLDDIVLSEKSLFNIIRNKEQYLSWKERFRQILVDVAIENIERIKNEVT